MRFETITALRMWTAAIWAGLFQRVILQVITYKRNNIFVIIPYHSSLEEKNCRTRFRRQILYDWFLP